MDNNKLIRFLLTFFLGWIGSLIINHTSLKPEGYTSRTGAYLILGYITGGISFMGLPCPNIFTGGMNFHGKFEYCSLQTMQKATQVVINLAQLWAK